MKRTIRIISCILAIMTCVLCVPISAYAMDFHVDKDEYYDIEYKVIDNGKIALNERGGYSYVNGNYDFSFNPYYLQDYALTENYLILNTSDEKILYAAINLIENSLEYVVIDNVEIKHYIVTDLKLSYRSNVFENTQTNEIVYEVINLEDDYDLFVSLARTKTWFTGYTVENANPLCVNQDAKLTTASENSARSATTITFTGNSNAVNAAIMTVGIYFNESYLKTVGCYSGKVLDTSDEIAGAYAVETYYDDLYGTYVSLVAIWDIDYTLIPSINGSCVEAIGTMTKKFNLFFEYSPSNNTASVVMAPDSSTYIITRNFDTMFRIYGSSNRAYIGEYGFYMNAGGSPSAPDSLVGSAVNDLLGARYTFYDYALSLYVYIRDALDALEYANYSNTKKAYEITNNSSVGYARTVASTYNSTLYKRYATCEARALIYNIPDDYGAMYFQIEFDITCINNSSTTHHARLIQRKNIAV